MKFRVEVCVDDTVWGKVPDEVEVEIADKWLYKMLDVFAYLEAQDLSSALSTYSGRYKFYDEGVCMIPSERIEGCHIKILAGGWFRFVFPFRDGPGDYADTDLLTLEDALKEN